MALAPPQPVYILRGHDSTIHSLFFARENTRLVSGDAQGWLVVWDMALKRPAAVWKAHEAAILGISAWEQDKLITQGRDGKIYVWQLRGEDEATLSQQLPVEDAITLRKQPWLLHSIPVSNLSFCSFAAHELPPSHDLSPAIVLATPGTADSAIHIVHLPSERLIAEISAPEARIGKFGMVMALALTMNSEDEFIVTAGYESGRTCVFKQLHERDVWEIVYTACSHDQPILSLDIVPDRRSYVTCGADAFIAQHLLRDFKSEIGGEASKIVRTGHAGQQGLRVRSDGKIFATAGWDGRGRVYSAKTMKELAVLKWHKNGCYSVAFAEVTMGNFASEGRASDMDQQSDAANAMRQLIKPTVEQLRNRKVKEVHWIALGSKDGKISLWDIY